MNSGKLIWRNLIAIPTKLMRFLQLFFFSVRNCFSACINFLRDLLIARTSYFQQVIWLEQDDNIRKPAQVLSCPYTSRLLMGSENGDRSEERLAPSTFTRPSGNPVGKYVIGPEKIFCGILSHPSPCSPLKRERLRINLFYFSPQFTIVFPFCLNFRYCQWMDWN